MQLVEGVSSLEKTQNCAVAKWFMLNSCKAGIVNLLPLVRSVPHRRYVERRGDVKKRSTLLDAQQKIDCDITSKLRSSYREKR